MRERKTIEIDEAKAKSIYSSIWWKGKSPREIAETQFFINRIICPFEIFHESVEKSLGRPVYSHEFAFNFYGIMDEFLGDKTAPTMEEILKLIPTDQPVIIILSGKGPAEND